MTGYTYPKRKKAEADSLPLFLPESGVTIAPPQPVVTPTLPPVAVAPPIEETVEQLNPLDLVKPRQRPPRQHESPPPKSPKPKPEPEPVIVSPNRLAPSPFVYEDTLTRIIEVRDDVPIPDDVALKLARKCLKGQHSVWQFVKIEDGYQNARLIHFQHI